MACCDEFIKVCEGTMVAKQEDGWVDGSMG